MEAKWYLLVDGRLAEHSFPEAGLAAGLPAGAVGAWLEVGHGDAAEVQELLGPLGLHPLQLNRATDEAGDPGVLAFDDCLLAEYAAYAEGEPEASALLTLLLKAPVLVTVRHGPLPALDDLGRDLTAPEAPAVLHLAHLVYLILDELADLTVGAQIALRGDIRSTAEAMAGSPAAVSAADLARLRGRTEALVALVENQLYCVHALSSADHPALQVAHRRTYIQDLVAEADIAQRGLYRLETRVRDLFGDHQAAAGERVERRLRLLTVISAITLPLGLLAGLLGMNVGGLPGTGFAGGFGVVVGVMAVVTLGQFWYFKRNGWFD